jgi:ethanolamine utilization protein EutQ
MAKRIITETDILQAVSCGEKTLYASPAECIVTAQARDKALEFGVDLIDECPPGLPCEPGPAIPGDAPELGDLVRRVVESMQGVLPPDADGALVARLVRDAVAARMSSMQSGGSQASGVIFVDSADLLAKATGTSAIKERTVLAEAFGRPGESKLAAGYLAWEAMSFERNVEAPEILVVIDGELHLQFDGRTVVARPGDMAYLPEGSRVSLSAPAKVRLACINGLA